MTIYICLLRGINVGGHNIIKMADLKKVLEAMGLKNVKTYIQSGNIVFESEEGTDFLRQRIEREIQAVFGFSVSTILKTARELEEILENIPYQQEQLSEGESLHITFLSEAPSREKVDQLINFKSELDECKVVGTEVYLYFRQSIRDSKLAVQTQKLGVPATNRNVKTVRKLEAMAKAISK